MREKKKKKKKARASNFDFISLTDSMVPFSETEDNVVNFLWSGGDLTKIEMINANLDESGQTLLNDYVSLAQKAGVKQISPIMIRSAKPPEALLNKLQELKPHVVVMGSTSKTAVVKQLLMGSTTKYIKEHITCTVVEVKDEYDPH